MFDRKVLSLGFSMMAIVLVLAATKVDSEASLRTIEITSEHDEPSISNHNDPIKFSSSNDESKANTIQLALILDTSSSMDGLIEQAKSQLWDILNNMINIEKDNQETDLEIALYEYGNPSKSSAPLFISKISDFTTDVDLISEKLFELTTEGGSEYCGEAIRSSLESLEWTNGDQLKMIYIAGNESFAQGYTDYTKSCQAAKDNKVFVNTIFCGVKDEGQRFKWEDAAEIAGGEYFNIDTYQETNYVSTPFDNEINQLNLQLNQTYIPYGEKGNEKLANQRAQDSNANLYGKENYRKRSIYKSSSKYKADDWDLVDAYKKDKNIINDKNLLREEQANMTIEELERQIEGASVERDSIKQKIQDLSAQAKEYKNEMKKTDKLKYSNLLEDQIIKVIKLQAESRGYQLKA